MNPEFRRNLWLELTPQRLIGLPAVLGAVLFLAYVSSGSRLGDGVAGVSVTLFILISMVWGTKLASEAVMNEIRDHTWDGQRMSAISPWQLAWGKLFGSTIFPWYGALICILFYVLSVPGDDPSYTLKTALVLLLSALLAHSVSLLASLTAIRKERRFNRSQAAALLVLGIIVAGPFMNMALSKGRTVLWFGMEFAWMDFLLPSVLLFVAWTVNGLYRMMRLELQMRNSPWWWLSFVLFLMFYGGGLFHGANRLGELDMAGASPALLAAFWIGVSVVYFMACAERKDLPAMDRLLRLAREGNPRRFLERAPRWLLTLILAFVAGGCFMLSSILGGERGLADSIFVLASMFFLLRDLGIMLFCNLAGNARRADMLFVLSLALLYGVFPAILAAMELEWGTLLFWPRVDIHPLWGCLAALLEALVMAYLVALRWKRRSRELHG